MAIHNTGVSAAQRTTTCLCVLTLIVGASASTAEPLVATDILTSAATTTTTSAGPLAETPLQERDRVRVYDFLSHRQLQTSDQVERHFPYGWKLQQPFQGIELNNDNSTQFLNRFRGEFTLLFSGVLTKETQGLLLLITNANKSLPYVELTVDIPRNYLVLRYLGVRSFQRVALKDVFPNGRWIKLEVSVQGREITATVDCQTRATTGLRQKIGAIPSDANVVFGGLLEGQSGIQGVVFSAELYSQGLLPRTCGETSNVLVSDQPLGEGTGFTLSSSDTISTLEDRIVALERRMLQLHMVVDTLQRQNSDLTTRMEKRETCECHPSCNFNGTIFQNGDTWTPDQCTRCTCVNSRPQCEHRFDLPNCAEPCVSSPCLNNGECINVDVDPAIMMFRCECPPPFDGERCQVRQNPCVWPVEPGTCDQEIVRYYYDILSQQCLPFMFTGCGGNVNNYHNLEECTTVALRGACCYRTYKTNILDVTRSTQELEIKCKELHMVECKALHRQPSGDETETEVISFNPGLTCSEASCQTVGTCVVGQRVYQSGDTFRLGCQSCECKPMGQVECKCERISVRKEIRDMTQEEILRFQTAVAELRRNEDRTWEQFRDMYMYHVMHASSGPFFLPWHRAFLRQVEQRLQEIDCNIVLPYFDFTTDVGFFEEAIIWQPNYFGGNGDGKCVESHPFGPKALWNPCFVRNFNTSIQLPTQVELLLALASDDYEEMSLCLETYVAYVHNFIGGDMMTSSSPYDPVFFAIHAYIDMLYWTWQNRNQNKFKFPAAYGGIPMIPFNIPPWMVFDSEEKLCVTYTLPSEGHPCNVTSVGLPSQPGVKRGDIDPQVLYGVDRPVPPGYSEDGFDQMNFDLSGYGRNGFNRDGYDRQGYDIGGYNRYGFNAKGYDRYGYDVNGIDIDGNQDRSGRFDFDGYDADCLNRQGLTREGLDQYGFYTTGLDQDGCSYYFSGPFSPLHSLRIFTILSQQPKQFLMTLPRTCTGLSPLPTHWQELNWVSNAKDVSSMVPVQLPDMQTGVSGRFCFDTRSFLTSCVCEFNVSACEINPCFNASCKAFPEAKCRLSFCGGCQAKWSHRGVEVDCQQDRDFCDPNPCLNGGTCQQSIWPTESDLVTCVCPPGFEGHLCQYTVQDPCVLPLSTGNCDTQETRFYYNPGSSQCEPFTYRGCGGNANNFASINECQAQCERGACCSRRPEFQSLRIGFDSRGYDKYGFDAEGYNLSGERRSSSNSFASSSRRFDADGFDWRGFNREGFDSDGRNPAGYNRQGYDEEGFNVTGYSQIGEYDGVIDYGPQGYDEEGFNRLGLNCDGYDRKGYDLFGVAGAYKYTCGVTTLARCQERARRGEEIVKFTPGEGCEDSDCGPPCGCRHGNKMYAIYEQFKLGCQSCSCTEKGVILCVCDLAIKRKEIREMSAEELARYQRAVRQLLQDTGYPSEWYGFASLYARHKPQASGNPLFLPWNRQFLRHVEQAIQNIDCGVAIPYYDWTIDAGRPYKSLIWAANIMGGNGGADGCVRYHPFKSYHPPYLSPCLKRRFSTNISLPSVINVELALREPSYDRFRLQLEMFARLYQSFVGGHMDSYLAPYDPLFYSVMAYIDKLWTDWQVRHPDGLLTFPLEYRYVRMDPFKSVPDDVFYSKVQLCVDYLPLTEGVPCNVTEIRTYGYNALGYDRHGYNREGFDKDGFDVKGYDSSGNADNRGIYNKDGYNREGFKRSGFDDSGIDRYGFYVDSYNLDDFDPQGYDRSGYNRFGFNQRGFTPFGYHMNGSYLLNINVDELGIFDSFGYNKYGFDQEGLDRYGQDIFGFDARGFNNRICNYYYLGPIHILVKKYVERTLEDLNITMVTGIRRICPQLSPLSDNMIRRYWLDREGQTTLLDSVYRYQIEGHREDTTYMPRETSITTDLIWLPIAPDERLCLVTEIYTDCMLGEPHMMCPDDMCQGRVCPDYPSAVCRIRTCGKCRREWYDVVSGQPLQCTGCLSEDGQKRREGDTWQEKPCVTCACYDGQISCETRQCPPITCQYPIQLPDQCCPSCNGCDYRGQRILSGSEFRLPDDPCSLCYCDQGNVVCQSVECPSLGECRNVVKPEGQCCPVCEDCGDYEHGDSWKQGPCTECTCVAGNVLCAERDCAVPQCEHPYTEPGQCCPVCSQCLYQGQVYRDGQEFSPEPCMTCTCGRGNVECATVACDLADCESPVTVPGQCCPSCDLECEYGGRTFEDGSTFFPEYNPCLNCSCSNSIVRCRPVRCDTANLPCRAPIRKAGECCPTVCPACEDQGVEYYEGDQWPSHNSPCDVCECIAGKVVCSPRADCPQQCTHGVIRPGECCSRCTDCLFEGRVVTERQTVSFSSGDTCRLCTCYAGNMDCRLVMVARECPRLRCERTEVPEGDCCPICAGCTSGGQKFKHGEEVSRDECSRCMCAQGEIVCDTRMASCPPTPCRNPRKVEGQCCAVCDTCTYYGNDYLEGESFRSPIDPCQNCVCQGGRVSCTTSKDDCPTVTCTHPSRRRDQCCPRCDSCTYQGREVRNGQRFSGTDPCETCACRDGSITCEFQDCPPVRCKNPVRVPGRCCPVCEGVCMLDGREYKEGDSFTRPGTQCEICVCQNEQITCKGAKCEHPECSHPATLPGECCPKCDFCLYEKKIFRNQQRFVHPQDPCRQCSCGYGTVTCTPVICEDLACSNPMPMPGSCCPVCPKQCDYGGLSYDDGETFVNPSNECEDCLCRQGVVQCKRRMCPQVDCINPIQGRCCPICSDCTFGVMLLVDGETVPDPDDPCRTCKCARGSVQCHSVSCPPVSCTNPVQVGCCPVCSDCEYRGRRYDNGAVITDADRCRTCICQEGTVQCQSNPCPAITCSHPSRGQCCDECQDCQYQGVRYRDGQKFSDPQTETCQECVCSKGNVMCSKKRCPEVACTHPAQGPCCRECRNCFYDGQIIREGATLVNPDDPCEECLCRQGSVTCSRKQCPDESRCRNPVQRGCCPDCSACSYRGTEYRSGERFTDPATQCILCGCAYGNVVCQQKTCPQVTCQNPVQGECCMECTDCYYNNRNYANGQRFPHPTDRCQSCQCRDGEVQCSSTDCSGAGSCTHPISVPGECCPVCGRDCLYQGQIVKNGDRFERNCQECSCLGGNVRCLPANCPPVTCTNPVLEGCCLTCIQCSIDGVSYQNGETFVDTRDPCSKCICRDGSVQCERRTCPPVQCSHPAQGQCCPQCDGCEFRGLSLTHGQRFADRTDRCSQCECQYGSVTCSRLSCPPASCSNPVSDECGCPVCRGCSYQGRQYDDGQTFPSTDDPCQECRCRGGSVICDTKPCQVTCSHPAELTGCCPRCRDCLYEGNVRIDGQTFVSSFDPCEKCQCQRGSVICQTMQCPQVTCLNPIKMEGECCPSCPLCVYLGQTYQDNQRFTHPEDSCQTCSCKMGRVDCESERCVVPCSHPRQDLCCPKCDACFFEDQLYDNGAVFNPDDCRTCSCRNGDVTCDTVTCPDLPCVETRPVEGQCCEVCQGCTFRGALYDDDASWVMPENPCISCTCHAGLVTCMDTECYVPCSNPISVPGQCCDVCPSCNYDGRQYSDGDNFTPNGDPCDLCQCEGGQLRCVHNTCPSVANCPAGSLRDPAPGSCCPTCEESFSTGCTQADFGQITRPRPQDPCFFCECKEDFMWICMKEECPPLSCPPDVQIYSPAQCCQSCPACYDVSEAKYHHEGSEWSAVDDPCIVCTCQNSEITCAIRECEPISCSSMERVVVPEGQCCEMCQPVADATCTYLGRIYQPGEDWTVDECTSCSCQGGRVKCNVRRCPPLQCDSDEAPVTTPGSCCPVCKKEPGTCLVYGDPHYRTFDGATYHFQGNCRYIMARDCETDLFSVEVQHDSRGSRLDVSWAQNLTVTVAGAVVDLMQGRSVRVNGQHVTLPYLYEPHLLIEESSQSLILSTEIGLRVLWDGASYGELTVPGSFKRQLCGLCGNFNGVIQDDLRTMSGLITNSPATFGNSWKAKTQLEDSCEDARDIDTCAAAGYRKHKSARSKCAILMSEAFSRCHRLVNPQQFFVSCVYDMCVCMEEPRCLCDIVSTYAHECARVGVRIEWRSSNLCAFDCDANKGLMFDECGPVCPRTCESIQVVGHNVTETCYKPCVPSCQCTADKVLHEGRCISPSQCPYIETVPVL